MSGPGSSRLARASLTTRLVLAMASLLAFASVVFALSVRWNFEEIVYPPRLARLAADARELAGGLDGSVQKAREDARLLRLLPATRRLAERLAPDASASGAAAPEAGRQALAEAFVALLEAKPDYLRVRLVAAGEGGREILRAERSAADAAVRLAPDGELRDRGDRAYVSAGLALPSGHVRATRIELDREREAAEAPGAAARPVLRVLLPVDSAAGVRVGLLVVDLDMSRIFERLRSGAPAGASLFVLDEQGNFLLHPEPRRSFAFAFGVPYRIGDELPALAGLSARVTADAPFTARVEQADGAELAFAAAAAELVGGSGAVVALSAPRPWLLARARDVIGTILASGLGALGAAGLLLVGLAWRTLRPLGRMAEAVEALERGRPAQLPRGVGEIGVLSGAFERYLARERLFSAAFAWANDPALTITPEGILTGWNAAAERLFGYSAEDAIGQPVSLIVPPDRLGESEEIRRRARGGEPVVDLETRRRDSLGRLVEVSLTHSPVRAADGRIVGASEILRDISGRRAEEARFRLAVEASPAGMLMTDEAGVILLANGAAESIFGYAAAELVGQPVEILLPEAVRSGHAGLRAAFLEHPGKRMMGAGRDLYARRKDGTEIPVEVGLSPLQTAQGLIVLSAIVDTTERKRSELALRLAKQQAERSSRMKTQFLANMSHELRTPLNAIIGYSELMLSEVGGAVRPAKYADYLEDIRRGGTHLLSLINDLLDLSRAESGALTLVESPVDLVELAEAAVKLMGAEAELKGLSLSLSAETRSLPLRGDERMITQILLNLLSNALKFTPEGGRVSVLVKRSGEGEPRLIVRDNGVGMPADQIPRAFAAFVQVENAYRRTGNAGAGLGLALTRRFVELHGGRIWLESKQNAGTVATVAFPAERCLPSRMGGPAGAARRSDGHRGNG